MMPTRLPPITVAHVVLGMQVGGLERVVANLVQSSAGSRFRPIVACLEAGGPFADELSDAQVPVRVFAKRRGWDLRLVRQLAAWFRNENVTIVHTHNPTPHVYGLAAGLLAGVPVRVHTKHGRNYPDNPRRVRLYRWLSRVTDMIVPVSDNARNVALEIEKVNPRKVRRIWNGVDTERYAPRGKRQEGRGKRSDAGPLRPYPLPLTPSPPTIGTVARLSPEKDQKTMLAAFKLVMEEWQRGKRQGASAPSRPLTTCPLPLPPPPLPRLVFAGDGPARTELEQHARDLGIAEHVDFLGNRSDIPTQLSTFDIFTLSSITEGISMTILEAMACEIPIVATDVGGNREIVQPPECGLIVPPRDPQALADAYLELLRDPERQANMGRAGRLRVQQHFSLEKMCADYRALYEELLAGKTGNLKPET